MEERWIEQSFQQVFEQGFKKGLEEVINALRLRMEGMSMEDIIKQTILP